MRTVLTVVALLTVAAVSYASGAPYATYVHEFTTSGTPNSQQYKTALPSLLSAMLDSATFTPVETNDRAEIEITGNYLTFGTVFTLDVTVKGKQNRFFAKVFEQGEKEEEIPSALRKLSVKIADVVKNSSQTATARETQPIAPAVAAPAQPASNVNRGRSFREISSSPPIDGALLGMAPGRKLTSGEREVFAASTSSIHYFYLGNKSLKLVNRLNLPASFKIIAIDTADLDSDTVPEVYVTVVDRGSLASVVYVPTGEKLEKIAGPLPYYFRSFTSASGPTRLYAQEMGMSSDFYGDVAEVIKNGSNVTLKTATKLPPPATLYNFITLQPPSSEMLYSFITSDGYLSVKSARGDEIWQSIDRYGGSETFFNRDTLESQRSNLGEEQRKVFLQQRMQVTADGLLIIPRNEGPFVTGNLKSYNRHSIHLLHWNGTAFREQDQSGQRAGYLADCFFDHETGELVTLEVPTREGMVAKGKSIISVLGIGRQP